MRLGVEDRRQLVLYSKRGPIYRPKFYLMHRDMGWQWGYTKIHTDHWSFAFGRVIFTVM